MNSYLFYDIETTGLNRAFDQVLQFSSIRTDLSFNELERHTIEVALRPDVTPSPAAMIVHGIDTFNDQNRWTELDATTEIHHLFNRPGTISLGYNTLGFDDEFLRFAFYRNLLTPYTHQFKDGCGRMDLYPVVILYYLFNPESLVWPETDGSPSLKLEDINTANNLAEGPAHDALVDTMASQALAKKLAENEKMWHYAIGYFDKTIDRKRIQDLPVAFQTAAGPHRMGLMVAGDFGTDARFIAPVLSIGDSIPYANQTLWLRLDLPELSESTAGRFDDTTWVLRKKLGEPGLLLPPLERYWRKIDPNRRQLVDENQKWLMQHETLMGDMIRYHREYRYPEIPNLDSDAALYDIGFMSKKDEQICRQFHAAGLKEKEKLAERFHNPVYRELAGRLLGRNFLDTVSHKRRRKFKKYLDHLYTVKSSNAPVDYRGHPKLTPAEARIQIDALCTDKKLTTNQLKIMKNLEKYLKDQLSG